MEHEFSSRFSFDDDANEEAKICVVGVGGGGGNAINNMVEKGIRGSVEFVAVNTDSQALAENKAPQKIQAGRMITKGLGAGARPGTGAKARHQRRRDANVSSMTSSCMSTWLTRCINLAGEVSLWSIACSVPRT